MLRIVVSKDGQQLGVGDYENDLVRIGSHDDNDLQIEDAGLSDHHAEFWAFNGVCNVRSPDDQPLTLSGRRIEGRGRVNDGDALIVEDFCFVVLIDPERELPEQDKKTYKTRRVILKGSDMLELPSREEEEELILKARRILVERGATQQELVRLRDEGVELAQEILREAASQGLLAAGRATRQREPPAATGQATREPETHARLAKLLGLLVAAGVCGGLMVYYVRELLLSFTG